MAEGSQGQRDTRTPRWQTLAWLSLLQAIWLLYAFFLIPDTFNLPITIIMGALLLLLPTWALVAIFTVQRNWIGLLLYVLMTVAFVVVCSLIASPVLMSAAHRQINRELTPVRDSLHEIQLALEKYACDNEGHYPPFLIGGSFQSEHENGKPLDPLLAGGYLQQYPNNRLIAGSRILRGSAFKAWLFRNHPSLLSERIRTRTSSAEDLMKAQRTYADPFMALAPNKRFGTLEYPLTGNCAADWRTDEGKYGLPVWKLDFEQSDSLEWASLLAGNFYYKARYTNDSPYPTGFDLAAWGTGVYHGFDIFGFLPGGAEDDCRLSDGSGVGEHVLKSNHEDFFGGQWEYEPDGILFCLTDMSRRQISTENLE